MTDKPTLESVYTRTGARHGGAGQGEARVVRRIAGSSLGYPRHVFCPGTGCPKKYRFDRQIFFAMRKNRFTIRLGRNRAQSSYSPAVEGFAAP